MIFCSLVLQSLMSSPVPSETESLILCYRSGLVTQLLYLGHWNAPGLAPYPLPHPPVSYREKQSMLCPSLAHLSQDSPFLSTSHPSRAHLSPS